MLLNAPSKGEGMEFKPIILDEFWMLIDEIKKNSKPVSEMTEDEFTTLALFDRERE